MALSSGHKLLVLRYNTDAFKIAGATRRTSKKERHAQLICLLGELLAREPEAPFTRLFLFHWSEPVRPPCPAAPRVRLPKFEYREPGSESRERCRQYDIAPGFVEANSVLLVLLPHGRRVPLKLKADRMQLKYMGRKSWLAPRLDLLLGDISVLHSPFFGSGKLDDYLARRPGLEPSSPSRYLRRGPVFLRSLLRLVGHKVDRRFYFRRLLPGALRGPVGRRAACSYALLRNSFRESGAPLRGSSLSSVRRLHRPPSRVVVRRQGALAYLRALPCQAPRQCIYADPPYIFPGRAMNYYGTKGRGRNLDALFSSGLPFVVSVNDVPEARELYSRADCITSPSCWCCVGAIRLAGAILLPAQD